MVNEGKIGGRKVEPLDQRGNEPYKGEFDIALSPIGCAASYQRTVW
jgi:hypothetical protein